MTRISWGSPGSKTFEAGLDRGVFYPQEGPGVPWNGLLSVTEDSSGSSIPTQHIDGVPFRSQKIKDGFVATLKAHTSPQEFDEYEGTPGILTRQKRQMFGLSYRTRIGNDISGVDHAYKIHLVYNALATPSTVDYNSTSPDGTDVTPFSWVINTTPIDIPGAKPAAHLIIDTSIAHPEAVAAVEDVLYGATGSEARLPEPTELMNLFEQHAILVIIDHGDGTWTAIGPDSAIRMKNATTFEITWPSAEYIVEGLYRISSL